MAIMLLSGIGPIRTAISDLSSARLTFRSYSEHPTLMSRVRLKEVVDDPEHMEATKGDRRRKDELCAGGPCIHPIATVSAAFLFDVVENSLDEAR